VLFQAGSSDRGRRFAATHAEAVFVGGRSLEVYRENVADIRRQAVEMGRQPDHIKMFAGAVVIVGKTRAEAEKKAEEYRRLSSAEGYLAHNGGSGPDFAAYPKDMLVGEILAKEARRGRDTAVGNGRRFYDANMTVGQAIESITRFDRPPFFAIGTPTEVADTIEMWVRETDLDGFNLRQFLSPGTAEDFIQYVVPELQNRGLYRTKYEESTLRERLFGSGQTRVFEQHPAARYRGGKNLQSAETIELAGVGA
jgi:alkanesulfonate monooxygenase SsuD/methylene tetrahydromethanopterin reductase-like flavin-dependent oxidoreductase (luciferase family)